MKENTYYARNREQCLQNVKAYQASRPEYVLWQNAKHRAKRKNLEFTITLDDIVIPELCPVYNRPIESPSIDRFDNSQGYTPENIRIISKRANNIKKYGNISDFEAIITYLKKG